MNQMIFNQGVDKLFKSMHHFRYKLKLSKTKAEELEKQIHFGSSIFNFKRRMFGEKLFKTGYVKSKLHPKNFWFFMVLLCPWLILE